MVWRTFLCILGRPFSSKEKRAAELARELAAQEFSRDDASNLKSGRKNPNLAQLLRKMLKSSF
jgi:hypothetical protein